MLQPHAAATYNPVLAARTLAVMPCGVLTGTLTRVDFHVPAANSNGDTVFDVLVNGVSIWAGSPSSRPKIVSGAQNGNVTGLSVAVVIGDAITIVAVTVPAGGIAANLAMIVSIDDGLPTIGPAGQDGSIWRVGTTAPDNSVGVNGDFYLRTTTGNYYQRISGTYTLQGNLVGPPGTPGSAGGAGQGFTNRGAWASGTAYVAYDVVQYNGSSYLAIASSTGVLPSSDVTKWIVFAAGSSVFAGETDVAWSNITGSSNTVDSNNTFYGNSAGGANAMQTINGIGGFVRFKVGDAGESTRYAGVRTSSPAHDIASSASAWVIQVRLDATVKAPDKGGAFGSGALTFAYVNLDEFEFECFDAGGGVAALRLLQNGVVKKTYTDALTFPLYFDTQMTGLATVHYYGARIKSIA